MWAPFFILSPGLKDVGSDLLGHLLIFIEGMCLELADDLLTHGLIFSDRFLPSLRWLGSSRTKLKKH